ncbi:hypothetical protein BT93_H0118 [Corymbia citriodora subsp. variegata]|nr:hypothetical protein BT93_H0118 [Corymbia citriodora subsp. variegata]
MHFPSSTSSSSSLITIIFLLLVIISLFHPGASARTSNEHIAGKSGGSLPPWPPGAPCKSFYSMSQNFPSCCLPLE